MENIESSELGIGSIVALNSHFYFENTDSKIMILSGDPKIISPLMVIIEMVIDKPSYDENTGMQLSDYSTFQCKCIWFSHKNYQFEDVWISSRLLKKIQIKKEKIDDTVIKKYGTFVELKTSTIEQGKQKSSFKKSNDSKTYTLTSELNFVSPIMQVVGLTKNESKEPLFNPKTLKPIRFISKSLIKCKYYNPISDKFSEALLPIESLNIVDAVNQSILDKIKQTLNNDLYIEINYSGHNELSKNDLIKPIKINFRFGHYYLDAYNYLKGRNSEYEINRINQFAEKKEYYIDELPKFNKTEGKLVATTITKDNVKLLIGFGIKYILISYENLDGVKSSRTIKNYELLILEETDGKKEKPDIVYLKGFCMLRNTERYFRLDRIKKIKVLNCDFEPTGACL